MKVYLNKYKYHWISPITIVDYMFFWTDWSKCSRNKYVIRNEDWVDSPKWADELADKLTPISKVIQWVWDKIDHKIDYVHIDRWDVWSADNTLALIITPLLKKLREDKHGHAMVDDEDAPEEIRSTAPGARDGLDEYDWDNFSEKRWNYVLDEMIWAFEQKTLDDDDGHFYDHSECDYKNGDFMEQMSKLKVDREGLNKHQERKTNGYRLFGKYYENLWT